MDIEIITLREVTQKEKDKKTSKITYMWNLKCDTNEIIYKPETWLQKKKTALKLTKGEGEGGGEGLIGSLRLAVSNYYI